MGKIEKSASAVSVIGGADGPTSVFIAEEHRPTIKQRIQGVAFKRRKSQIEKCIKAEPHSMSEVMKYITEKYGFVELERGSDEYQIQYEGMRASFIMEYAPELLGEYAECPQLMSRDEEGIRKYIEQQELRQKAAASVSEELFDIDFHIFKKKLGDGEMDFLIETKYEYIGGGFNGSGNIKRRQYEKMYRDVYGYYGVSKEDIDNKTKRYEEVVRMLAIR